MRTTRTRAALTGAIALNIPTLYWVTQLSAATALLAAVTLAAVGAGLGALAAFGFTRPLSEATPLPQRSAHRLERRAA
jgi:hypothetical protein